MRPAAVLLGVLAAKAALLSLCCCGAGPIGLFGILAEDDPEGPPAAFALLFYWGLAAVEAALCALCGVASAKLYRGERTPLAIVAATVGAATGLVACDMVNLALSAIALVMLLREPPSAG